jgi:hypothetical protein
VSLAPSSSESDVWRWRLAALVLLVGTAAWHGRDLAMPGLADRSGRLKAPDFLQFYTYGALVRSGRAGSLYDEAAHAAVARAQVHRDLALTDFRPNYSPVIAWLCAPLASWGFAQALAWWWVLTVVLYALAVWLTVWAGTEPGRDRMGWDPWLMMLAAAAFPALFSVLRYGQLSALSLLLVSGACAAASARRNLLAGLLLGLLAYKPNLLLIPVLVFVLIRQWPLVAGLVLGATLETAANITLAGTAAMAQYGRTLLEIARHPELVQFFPAESHSVRGFVRLLLPWPPVVAAAGWVAIPLGAWMAVRVWSAHEDWRPRWAALVLAMLLASPHLLTYDLLLGAVPLLLLADWHLTESGRVPAAEWRWGLGLLYFGAWPGTFIARLFHVQVSTVGMAMLLWLLARPLSAPARPPAQAPPSTPA